MVGARSSRCLVKSKEAQQGLAVVGAPVGPILRSDDTGTLSVLDGCKDGSELGSADGPGDKLGDAEGTPLGLPDDVINIIDKGMEVGDVDTRIGQRHRSGSCQRHA